MIIFQQPTDSQIWERLEQMLSYCGNTIPMASFTRNRAPMGSYGNIYILRYTSRSKLVTATYRQYLHEYSVQIEDETTPNRPYPGNARLHADANTLVKKIVANRKFFGDKKPIFRDVTSSGSSDTFTWWEMRHGYSGHSFGNSISVSYDKMGRLKDLIVVSGIKYRGSKPIISLSQAKSLAYKRYGISPAEKSSIHVMYQPLAGFVKDEAAIGTLILTYTIFLVDRKTNQEPTPVIYVDASTGKVLPLVRGTPPNWPKLPK